MKEETPLVLTVGQLRDILLHYWLREPPKSLVGAKAMLEPYLAEMVLQQKLAARREGTP